MQGPHMASGDFFVCLVAGFAVPFAILDAARVLLQDGLPEQAGGAQLERRLMPWLLGILAGPALLFDRIVERKREDVISTSDLTCGVTILVGWATIYGFVLLRSVRYLTFLYTGA